MADRFRTDPQEEILILTTPEGQLIGQAKRKDCHKGAGKTHWGLLAIIKRSNGDIVLAKRSRSKSVFPGIWDGTVATHVLPGDTPESASARETQEELGIDMTFKTIGAFFYQAKDGDYSENEYCTVLIGKSDATIVPNPQEVSAVESLSFAEMVNRGNKVSFPISPWFKTAIELFGGVIESA